MHISDGVLPLPVLAAGWAATVGLAAWTLRGIEGEDLPRTAVMTSVFFVASLIHVPLGPTSVHLILNGLVGVILGGAAFPAILLGLVLQAVLFQHGGLTTIGVNAIMMGLPALAVSHLFRFGRRSLPGRTVLLGFFAGASGTLLSGCLLALFLATAGAAFFPAAKLALITHLPVMFIEGGVTAGTVNFLLRVEPKLLGELK